MPVTLPPAGTFANTSLQEGGFKTALESQLAGVTELQASGATQAAGRVQGLRGQNNTGTPNTQYECAADAVVLRRTTEGSTITKVNTGTLTVNLLTAGPAINGRDQAGVFAANSWVQLYFACKIDGTGLGLLASLAVPPTGPTLPATYTHWAFATSLFFNASSQLVSTRTRASWVHFQHAQLNSSFGGTSLSPVTAGGPPNALHYDLEISANVVAGGTVPAWNTATVATVGATDGLKASAVSYLAGNGAPRAYTVGELPNVDGQLYVVNTPFGSPTTATLELYMRGYQVANGDS